MVDETGDHFVVYFLPSDETKRLRRLDAENSVPFTDGASYEYEKTREYNWNVKNKTMANYDENYFFVFRKEDKDCPAGVYYNELETRVRLSKRRKMQPGLPGGAPTMPVQPSKMRLVVQHRDFTYEELQAQTARLDMLKHESEDEEEEEEADDQEETEDQQQESASKKIRGSSSGESDSDGSSSPAASPKGLPFITSMPSYVCVRSRRRSSRAFDLREWCPAQHHPRVGTALETLNWSNTTRPGCWAARLRLR